MADFHRKTFDAASDYRERCKIHRVAIARDDLCGDRLNSKAELFSNVSLNRRIDIVVLTKKAQKAIEGEQGAEPVKAQELPKAPVDPTALPADQQPMPAHEPRQKLNLFDDKAPATP